MPLLDLSGKVALVTGGSRGIGAATVRLLAEAGADVALTFRERSTDAERVVARVRELGRRGLAIEADLATRDANDRAVAKTVETLGRLDLLVANAGIWPPNDVSVTAMTDERWRRTLAINLDAVFFGCRAALGAMQPGSAIVIITSTAGQRGEANHADYAASKGALISFVKSLAVEAAPDTTVNSVAPGWVDTEMCAQSYAGEGRARIEQGIPLGHVATPEDIAGPVVFLCSSLARHITGEILNVNGGAVLCG